MGERYETHECNAKLLSNIAKYSIYWRKAMKISEVSENTSAAFATSMGGGNGFANGGPGVIKRKKAAKESIYAMNKEDPNDPEVLINGYGRMNLSTLKRTLTKDLEEIVRHAESDSWGTVDYILNQQGVLSAKLKALLDAVEELEGIRKKGGPKSRGINKR